MTQTERLLTTGEAAQYLAERLGEMNKETLRRWAASGRVRHITLPSGHRRFSKADLDAALRVHEPERVA